MAQSVVILGGGMIGSAMALDLVQGGGFDVTVADVRTDVLSRVASRTGARTRQADLSTPAAVRELVGAYDLVIGALPSQFGYRTLQAILEAGRNCVDISFMPQEATDLDGLAREKGVTAVVDCGVAPGVSNLMVGRGAALVDTCEAVEIYVGGLPQERRWPFEYKAGFSPGDVIEEYVRPSRFVENGKVVVKEALSEPELLDFPGVGTLEAFNTDGLRSLIHTIRCPNMKEKTMRYPGHAGLMKVLRETGLFSQEPIEVKGARVKPLDLMSALLFPKWTFAEGEGDVTVMRVSVTGTRGGQRTRHVWDLVDRYDPESGLRSMSRTTGFPATAMLRELAAGRIPGPGVFPPEILGAREGVLDHVIGELKKRGVRIDYRAEAA
jgi:lysine 6-dehydrogenase